MRDRPLLLELFLEIEEAIRRIERRFSGINTAEDFLRDDAGLDRLDAIAMMLITIGKNLQRVINLVDPEVFEKYPDSNWAGARGIKTCLPMTISILMQKRFIRSVLKKLPLSSVPFSRFDMIFFDESVLISLST